MKILVLTRYFPLKQLPSSIGGVSLSLKSFYNTFKQNNHKLSVFTYQREIKSNIILPKYVHNIHDYNLYNANNFLLILKELFRNLKQIYIQNISIRRKLQFSLFFFRSIMTSINIINFSEIIRKYDKQYDYDIILCYHSTIPAYIGSKLKKRINKKLIVISHGNDIIGRNYNFYSIEALKNADNIIVRSNFVKNLVIKLYKINEKKIFICPDGVIVNNFKILDDKLALREELNLSKKDFIILTIGTLYNVRKGFDLVLKAIKELRDTFNIDLDNIKFLLIGRDDPKVRKWLYNLAQKYNLTKNFKILINVSDDLRNKYYNASDIFVMPSRDLRNKGSIEGFGNVFIEAGYYCLPTIGSNTGGIPDAIENGKSGFLINNFEELTKKIKLLYEKEDLRSIMGSYAHKRVMNNFVWKKIYLNYMNAFNDGSNKDF